MVFTVFMVIKNNFQHAQAVVSAAAEEEQAIEQHEGLANRWVAVNKDFNAAMQGFLVKSPIDFKNIVQDKAWANNINLVDMRSGQDMSGILGVASLELTVSGSYKEIVKFVQALEESHLRIMRVSIKGEGKKKDASMMVYCYFAKSGENG
jgi:hypothetical protein